ncbi:late secretory pathway protein AVL9 homolog isoform X2 [Oratosquilla oratoria]|uniref:late secretory pathway protein AVL9 homolog isoform X2 n=1 Tax=Oratosquilla oratoria TaxID=337810 RepID=UPI003F764DB9
MEDSVDESVVLHVIVVGFHHKKGMQVDFAYPPLCSNNESDIPHLWRHLPSLCLPDGAHNHEADVVYFHLPHLKHKDRTVFGVSCYRQVEAEKVANKTADITRNTVQKSVCVLSTLPIYGYIQERLQVTTKVYFKGADFSDVQDLKGLYHDLNNANWKDKLLHGVSVSDVVKVYGRNVLVLFKLLLLEKRVMFIHSPVGPLVKILTSLLALLPYNFQAGLAQAAATRCWRSSSEMVGRTEDKSTDVYYALEPLHSGCDSNEADPNEFTQKEKAMEELDSSGHLEDWYPPVISDMEPPSELKKIDAIVDNKSAEEECENNENLGNDTRKGSKGKASDFVSIEEAANQIASDAALSPTDDLSERRSSNSSLTSVTSRGSLLSPEGLPSAPTLSTKISSLRGRLSGAFSYWTGRDKSPTQEKPSATTTPHPSPSEPEDEEPVSPISDKPTNNTNNPILVPLDKIAALDPAECGLPLNIFTKGNMVHPYLSLQYLDLLSSPSTRAFLVGASNQLFRHKKHLFDVIVQVDDGKIDILDPDLRKQLSMSMEDLRFAEHIVKQVEAANISGVGSLNSDGTWVPSDIFLEGVGWVGGEEWLRYQFKIYLLSLMRSSLCQEWGREWELFNSLFVNAWRNTHNYRVWSAAGPYMSLLELSPGHPHAGTLSMADMKIRLSHTIQGLDKGRKINQTLATTGTAVVKTREAVGGAITSAKGALTNLWSTFTTPGAGELAVESGNDALQDTESQENYKKNTDPELAVEANEMLHCKDNNMKNMKSQENTETPVHGKSREE